MAVNDPTTTYGWDLPADGGSNDTWGTELNEMIADLVGAITSIDEVLAALQTQVTGLTNDMDDVEDRADAVDASNTPAYARAVSSAATNITKNTATILSWTSAPVNAGTMWAAANATRLTVPTDLDGVYGVRAMIEVQRYAGSGDNARLWEIRLLKNGAEIATTIKPYTNAGNDTNSLLEGILVESLIQGTPGDYFEVQVLWNEFESSVDPAVVNPSLTAYKTYFEAIRYPGPVSSGVWEACTSYIPITKWGGSIYGSKLSTSFAFTDGNAHYTPFIPSEDMTIDKLAFAIIAQTAGDAGTARMGIYATISATDHRPGALLGQTANIATLAAAAEFETSLGTAVNLTKGTVYWLAFAWKVTTGGALEHFVGGDGRAHPHIGQGSFGTGNETGDVGIESVIGTAWSTLPDPAVLTSESFKSNLTAILAHRSA